MLTKRIVCRLLKSTGYEIRKRRSDDEAEMELPFIDVFDLLVAEHIKTEPDPFFVQIGAHDGKSADPVNHLVHRHHLRGLLVEPQPLAFQKLLSTYSDEHPLLLENALISDTDGTRTLYAVRDDGDQLPFWLHQSASLDRETVCRALRVFRTVKGVTAIPKQYESMIAGVPVPSLTWSSLLGKYGIKRVDFLIIDTMGFDFEIIKTLPLDRSKPRIIHFEHALLSARDQRACLAYLSSYGYSVCKVAVDTIACLDVCTRSWAVGSW